MNAVMSAARTTGTATTSLRTTRHTLAVPGGALHYQLTGSGPLLLIAQSGEGDADRTVDLVAGLADTYTVVTYDRRGLSRSRPAGAEHGASLTDHADDVARLLRALTDSPVLMLGCSLGALIGLHTAVRHPGLIGTLIAHEPVAPRLLPAADRARHQAELVHLRELYASDGLAPVFREIARTLGIDTSGKDSEPGLTPQPMDARRIANFDRFLRHDLTAIVQDPLDPTLLRDCGTRILPAVGAGTPSGVFDVACVRALAELLGTEVHVFPGGHNGNTSHPRAYAARMRELFAEAA
ncbi:alpha/beta fold hydrolase [Streptomyces sp. NPDC090025]|uniref:alpha/beta fold hydrolase n=1 Tax=Streptomyces sp. NPDC090025 TaxID=3365922 RepID=UPI00383603F5